MHVYTVCIGEVQRHSDARTFTIPPIGGELEACGAGAGVGALVVHTLMSTEASGVVHAFVDVYRPGGNTQVNQKMNGGRYVN